MTEESATSEEKYCTCANWKKNWGTLREPNRMRLCVFCGQELKVLEVDRLVMEIVDVFRSTPVVKNGYICHGEFHDTESPNYPTITMKVQELINQNKSEGTEA